MDERLRKETLKETFNSVSGGYDGPPLRFFSIAAEHMADLLGLRRDEQVIDVACSTGNAALVVASRLAYGRVTGVDFSPKMLDQARRKAAALNVQNVDFIERDMKDLRFSDSPFDVALCAFGIFLDAGKNIHDNPAHTGVDPNRAGTALLEIVTEPGLHAASEVMEFARGLHGLVRWLGASEANMEMGQMRFEPNVNLQVERAGRTYKTPIVEVKNLN